MKIKSKAKLIKGICSGVWWAIVGLLAVCIVSILGAKMQGKVPRLFGYSVLQIVSGSMETEIPQGSYILVKKWDVEKLQEEDIICFYSSDPQIYGMPNTHRIKGKIEDENGLRFITKGDANPTNDTVEAEADNVIGKYVGTLTGITSFSKFLEGKTVFVVLIVVQIATAVIAAYTIISKKTKEEDDSTKK